MVFLNSFRNVKYVSVLTATSALLAFSSGPVAAQDLPPPPSVSAPSASESSAPNMGSFESLLNSLPQPKAENQNQQAVPNTMAQPNMANAPTLPGLSLPQGNMRGGVNQPPPLPGLSADEVGGLSREEQLKLRGEKEKKQFYDEAYGIATDSMFPLKPEEIRRFMQLYDENRQAIDTIMYNTPTPEVGLKTLSLDPGHTPDVIDVAMGTVTTVSIVDVTGQPWPVKDMTWAGEFDIIKPGQGESIFRITPTTHHAKGNMSIRLIGLKTPVVIGLNTRRDRVYYRLDLRIPEYGPEANAPLINSSLSIAAGGNASLASILDGLPPESAERLVVTGADRRTKAYKVDGLVYVRTPLTLLSPGWNSSVKSGDGMNVYELNSAPILLLSDGGKMVRASLTEDDTQ
jgi:intracellular multiplication protein IcmK|tara:strand:- start:62041 stop:63243 length:1203 start_codon:yes stop_codon:yes gene_type:complete